MPPVYRCTQNSSSIGCNAKHRTTHCTTPYYAPWSTPGRRACEFESRGNVGALWLCSMADVGSGPTRNPTLPTPQTLNPDGPNA